MEIRHLRLVKTVAEEGNLTNAGKRLYLSQSALSHQLREMEEEFGTPIFQRINKHMVLTEVGNRLLQTACSVLCELQRAATDVRKYVNGEAGVLRLSTECYTVYHWLPKLLQAYGKQFPHVEVQIVAEATRRPKEFLSDGKLDVAIVSCLSATEGNSSFEFTQLFTDEMVILMSAEHPLAERSAIEAKDFENEHLICYTAPIEALDIFQRVLIPAGVTPRKTIKIQLSEAIVEMVKANMGISAMAGWAIKPYLKSKRLVAVPLAEQKLRRTWYAVTIKSDRQPAFITAFVRHLLDHPLCS